MIHAVTVPVNPDEDTAHDWLVRELAKSEYQQAKPNAFDEFVTRIWDWFQSLFTAPPSGIFGINPAWLLLILGIIIAVILLVLFGRPRALARTSPGRGSVFVANDLRSSAQLRQAASQAAAAENWSLALVEQYRALTRALSDRTLIRVRPGTTAQLVAFEAAAVFPEHREALRIGAGSFDAVRYANRSATQAQYSQVRDLDTALEHTRPELRQAVSVS